MINPDFLFSRTLSKHDGKISQKEYLFELENRSLIMDAARKQGKSKEITKKDMQKLRACLKI